MMRTFFLVLLVLCSINTASGNQRKIRKLAKCFNSTSYVTVAETKTCLSDLSTCFLEDTTVEVARTCVADGIANLAASKGNSRFLQDTGNDGSGGEGFGNGGFRPGKGKGSGRRAKLLGVVRDCLEPVEECIKEEVRAFIRRLPECVNTTAVALGTCYKDNADSCSSTCSSTSIPSSNPFQGANRATIKTCDGFQDQIMNPSCTIVDCCPQCQTQFDDLMTCVGQDLIKLKPEPCDLACPATRRRNLAERYVPRTLATKKADPAIIAEECAGYLDTEDGTITEDGIAGKILEGEFVGCVADISILVAEEQAGSAGDKDAGGKGKSAASRTSMAIAGLLSALLGLISLM